jgi:hypothetical protein
MIFLLKWAFENQKDIKEEQCIYDQEEDKRDLLKKLVHVEDQCNFVFIMPRYIQFTII